MSRLLNDYGIYGDYSAGIALGQVKNPGFDFQELINALDCQQDFYGVGVVFNDGFESFVVRPPRPRYYPKGNAVTHIIISKIPTAAEMEARNKLKEVVSKPSVNNEIFSTVLACSSCILYFSGTLMTGTSTVLTGGLSTPLAIVSMAGTIATSLQCATGIARIIDIEYNDGEYTEWVDSRAWYEPTMKALDMISIFGASADLYLALKTFRAFKAASNYATVSMRQWLQGLNRAQRINISKDIIKHYNRGVTDKEIRAWFKIGRYPKNISTQQVMQELTKNLNNTVMSSMSFWGSASSNTGLVYNTVDYAIGMLNTVEEIN